MPKKAVAPEGYLTSEEARTRLSISKPTIGRWAKAGKICPYKYQGAIVFKRADVEKLAAAWEKVTRR